VFDKQMSAEKNCGLAEDEIKEFFIPAPSISLFLRKE
jgi:hypothetical protein